MRARQHGADEERDQWRQVVEGVAIASVRGGDAGQHRVAGHVGREHAAHGDVTHRVGDAGDDGQERGLERRGGRSLHHVVGDLDLGAEAVALAGQDPIVGEIIVRIDVVLRQHDLAPDALGRARGAEAFLAGRQRVEPAPRAARGCSAPCDRGTCAPCPSKWMVISLRITSPSSVGSIGTASLPEASKRCARCSRHAGAEQRALDQGHERTGPAQIGFRRLEALQRGDDLLGLGGPWLASR